MDDDGAGNAADGCVRVEGASDTDAHLGGWRAVRIGVTRVAVIDTADAALNRRERLRAGTSRPSRTAGTSRSEPENPRKTPLEIIEVRSGVYLGEDDIVRFDDQYGRADA